MIISRTPLRVSFVGGGSDLPDFYTQHGGAVVSMAIRKYVYLTMHENFQRRGSILKYSELEKPSNTGEIRHRIIRQVFSDLEIDGVDFNSSADVPAGTGMGSSSAFTVGLLNLCLAYRGVHASKTRLAEMACEVELEKLGETIGKQDQYGCALGGINFIEFHQDGSVTPQAVPLNSRQRRRLEDNLVMVYVGGTRSASELLSAQSEKLRNSPEIVENMKSMAAQAHALRSALCQDVDVLGPFLHEAWQRKQRVSADICTPEIADAYRRAIAAGATGGKLLGAGRAGFLLFYAPGDARHAIVEELAEFTAHDVQIDPAGSVIIYSD
jgi:D-glycero-alpha-D-manno-heptose-7-phosphate kinase